MTTLGFWDERPDIDVVDVDGTVVALAGWQGEIYGNCWEILDARIHENMYYGTEIYGTPGRRCTARPVYRFQVEDIDLDTVEENSDEWYRACEIVDYNLTDWRKR